jgi:hypothetical protein
MSFDPNDRPDPQPIFDPVASAKSKVTVPGILLIVTAVFNLLLGAYWVFNGIILMNPPEAVLQQMREQAEKQKKENPQGWEQLEKSGWTPEALFRVTAYVTFGLGIVSILSALIIALGGILMVQAKSYGLCVFASILAAVPCVSPCCVPGMIAGIWGLVVLFNNDVKAVFK